MSNNRGQTNQLVQLEKAAVSAVVNPQYRVDAAMAWAATVVKRKQIEFTSEHPMQRLADEIIRFAETVGNLT